MRLVCGYLKNDLSGEIIQNATILLGNRFSEVDDQGYFYFQNVDPQIKELTFVSKKFGTKTQFKREILTEIAATLAFSALQNNDKVGLVLFSDQIELFIPPKKGRSHILRIIRELLEFKPKSTETNISAALEFLSGVLKKKAIVFILSDFMDSGYEKTLRITAKKHDLTGIRVYDPVETELPKLGIVPMRDAETSAIRWINTHSKKVRNQYAEHYNKRTTEYQELFQKNGAGNLSCSVEESYVKKLLGYFKARI